MIEHLDGEWIAASKLPGTNPQHIVSDHFNPARLYLATYGQGLYVTDDYGLSWKCTGKEITNRFVTAVEVSTTEENDGFGVVYAGTEPSAFYRSDDGGATWDEPARLTDIVSSSSWSFPPKPDTHHVRYILADPVRSGAIYVAIEAGALIRSFDGGYTWKDRVRGGPYDTHVMTTNASSPGRLYSSAGDGYFESSDYGESWDAKDRGLRNHYLYCVSVHPSDPDTVLVSASPSPWRAYSPGNAESHAYRKINRETWREVKLDPESYASTVSVFAPNPKVEKEFYAANSLGIYRSVNAGLTWEKLPIPWSDSYKQNVWSLALTN